MVGGKKLRILLLCFIWLLLVACHKEQPSIPYTDADPYDRIFYVYTIRDGLYDIPQQTLCVIDHNSGSECLVDASMYSYSYVRSPDGKWVAFDPYVAFDPHDAFDPYHEAGLYIMSSTGAHMRRIAEGIFTGNPQWLSNDVLVFEADGDSAVIMDISTDDATTIAGDVATLSLSTNKELIVFSSGYGHIYLLDVDELTITELVDDKWIYRGDFAWSTNDQYIATKRIDKEYRQVSQLVVIDVETGDIQVVHKGVDHDARYAWSPEGDWLAFDVLLDEGEGISFVNIEDGTVYKVIDNPNIFIDAWSENGRGIIGTQWDWMTGHCDLVMLDIESEDIEILADCGDDWCNAQLR